MKFLEVDSLDKINTAFVWETSECILTGRVEAYSCKSAGTDKKLFRTLENRYNGHPMDTALFTPANALEMTASAAEAAAASTTTSALATSSSTAASPPEAEDHFMTHQNVISPFGRLTESAPRKTFFYLLATLNAAFPDNDFEDVRPDQFIKLPSVEMVINSVNTTLFNLGNDVIVNKYRLWDVLDEIVQLGECDVYTYNSDVDDDPLNEEDGYLWSMNYFFFNRKLKRMVFFSCKSESRRYDELSMEDME
ncbi:repressor of RNA polymerase III transcription Maf1 [Mycotypha africana]|uniref:repressor of RNA polymerase III transcription Maf1 n=1 Tax=Mycotypha africana TaxID=64632 RepID=UPI0023011ACD|nr:repressor of RNA polymerase III transcription Maf1 [Mycotypha africana]KAI8977213.1 repressor of RNA polymerase III transcription Maf1 [Mycotypha africana]